MYIRASFLAADLWKSTLKCSLLLINSISRTPLCAINVSNSWFTMQLVPKKYLSYYIRKICIYHMFGKTVREVILVVEWSLQQMHLIGRLKVGIVTGNVITRSKFLVKINQMYPHNPSNWLNNYETSSKVISILKHVCTYVWVFVCWQR